MREAATEAMPFGGVQEHNFRCNGVLYLDYSNLKMTTDKAR